MACMRAVRLAVASLLVATAGALSQAQPAGEKPDPPVEQTKKNIRVLQGLPSSQLIPVMTVIANSLGVTCSHCHGEAWESDEKPAKAKARQMIVMLRRINEQGFEGKTTVSCNTCHRGSTRPVAEPDIDAAGWMKPRLAAVVPRQLPAAEDVLTRYVSAVDGKGQWAAIRRRVAEGIVTRYNGRREPVSDGFDLVFARVDAQSGSVEVNTELSYPPEAEGGLAWSFPRPNLRDAVAELEARGVETVGGRDAFVVAGTPKGGGPPLRLVFDAGTGLLLRVTRVRPTLVGPLPERFDLGDYRDVDGVMVPFLVQWSRGDYQVTFTFEKVRHER